VVAAAEASGRVRVLFLCTHNSAMSQMAEGLLRTLAAWVNRASIREASLGGSMLLRGKGSLR